MELALTSVVDLRGMDTQINELKSLRRATFMAALKLSKILNLALHSI